MQFFTWKHSVIGSSYFWTGHLLDNPANWREIQGLPFANQAANPPMCPTAWPSQSRVRQEWVSGMSFLLGVRFSAWRPRVRF